MARVRLEPEPPADDSGPPSSWLARKVESRAAVQFLGQSDDIAERRAFWDEKYRRQWAGYGEQLRERIRQQEGNNET